MNKIWQNIPTVIQIQH